MPLQKIRTTVAAIAVLGLLGGCATQSGKDPLESLNRGIYKFNDTVDRAALKPVASAYKAVLPDPVQSGVNNFFSNLGDIVTAVNDLLQGKFDKAMNDVGRVAINSTFGILGIFDIASKEGIEKRHEDFGQTLAHWGWNDSTYLVLPFLGPSTLRDTGGLVVDSLAFDPIGYLQDPTTRNRVLLTKFVDKRASYLPGSDLLDEAALDPYSFMRDAYLQRRNSQVFDGNVPAEAEEPAETL